MMHYNDTQFTSTARNMKKYLSVLLGITIVLVLLLTYSSNRLSGKIESMLRDDAVAVLGLAVEVKDVDIHLARGQAGISGLKIANPRGFPSSHVFDLSSIQVDISTLSLLPAALGWRPYRVEAIRIKAPEVTVDVDEQGRSNLDQIAKSVQQSQQDAAKGNREHNNGEKDPSGNTDVPGKPGERVAHRNQLPRFRVDQLTIENLSFTLNRAGKAPESGTLPDIQMEDIGGQNGTTVAGLGVKVSSRLAGDILGVILMRKASERLNGRAGGLLKNLLNNQENN